MLGNPNAAPMQSGVAARTTTGTLDFGDGAQPSLPAVHIAQRAVGENSVYCQSNQMARAVFNGASSVHSHRLLALSLAKVDRNADGLSLIEIRREELRQLFPAYARTNRLTEILDRETDNLMKLVLTSRNTEEASSIDGKRRRNAFDKINLIKRCTYRHDGTLLIQFHEDVKPHITGLRKEFTQTRLRYICQLETEYQHHLYRFLCSHAHKDEPFRVSVHDLRELLAIPEGSYPLFAALERSVLKPAIDGINRLTDLRVAYEKRQMGRSVGALQFHVVRNSNKKLLPVIERSLATLMHGFGMAEKLAVECVSVQGFDYAMRRYVFARMKRDLGAAANPPVTKPGGYLKTLCENGVDPKQDHERWEATWRQARLEVCQGAYGLLDVEQRGALDAAFCDTLDQTARRMFESFGHDHHSVRLKFQRFLLEGLLENATALVLA